MTFVGWVGCPSLTTPLIYQVLGSVPVYCATRTSGTSHSWTRWDWILLGSTNPPESYAGHIMRPRRVFVSSLIPPATQAPPTAGCSPIAVSCETVDLGFFCNLGSRCPRSLTAISSTVHLKLLRISPQCPEVQDCILLLQ